MSQESNLIEKISHLYWLLHKQQRRAAHHGEGPMADTSSGQGRILAFLKIKDGISTKELSYLLGIRVSSLNELLAKLEKSGYLYREPSEQDKRVMLIKLTEKGKSEEKPPADRPDVFASLSVEEQASFDDYLDRIILTMEENMTMNCSKSNNHEKIQHFRKHRGNKEFHKFHRRGHGHGEKEHKCCKEESKASKEHQCKNHSHHDHGHAHGHGHGHGEGKCCHDE
ncbi:MarR family winged helix-turn-helix transcriptional regulator [Vagococcus elongatus]|uniref:HTH marR-type domain-containing protein n=1 Tax=Vagococcus elongatus TaxID=180344 RepID=A0A430B4D1_9ENTE|nr:MarR family transcriptional regulator [Vagococcus elongatus]RSU15197.1 hypothetical protein CBF29_02360 [Vagococcus elongatus]